MSVIIICNAGQFHPNYQQNASAYVWGLNEKVDFFYEFQKWEKKIKTLVDFGVFFSVSRKWNQQKKKTGHQNNNTIEHF